MLKCFEGAGPLAEDDEDDFVFSGPGQIPVPQNATAAEADADDFEYVDYSSSMDDWETIAPAVPADVPPSKPKMIHRVRDALWGTLYPEKPAQARLDVANGGEIVHIMGGHQVPVPHLGDLVEKLIWSTYRTFQQFGKSESTTDAHWGCMYRAAQMALTNALLRQLPGSSRDVLTECIMDGPEHLFSLQNMVQERKRMGRELHAPGAKSRAQVSPLVSALILQRLHTRASVASMGAALPCPLGEVVLAAPSWGMASDGGSGVGEALSELHRKKVLLMLPVVMPPKEQLDWRQLQLILELPQSSGLLGGCDNRGRVLAALESAGCRYYIFGSHAGSFLALDPHYLTSEFVCREPKVIRGRDLDASLLMVFVLSSQEDLVHLREEADKYPYLHEIL